MPLRVLIRGAGEQASGTAHRLFRSGLRVVMLDLPRPTMVRRWVSFGSALYEEAVQVEGVTARRWELADADGLESHTWRTIPVFADPRALLVARWSPDVLIDARLLKRNEGNHLDQAPLVIGFGPGLEAGVHVHAVVETHRGHDLGRIITQGYAAPDTGVPGTIGGQSAARVLRSPCEGRLEVLRDIGSGVLAGEELARVAGSSVHAEIDGMVRGMIHPGEWVERGWKLGDVDPRCEPEACRSISDKARTISGAAPEVILRRFPLLP